MKIKQILQLLMKDESKLASLVQAVFKAIDVDSSGEMDENELFNALKQVATDDGALKLEDVRSAMSELDTYNDGKITLEEFSAMIIASLNFLYQRESNS